VISSRFPFLWRSASEWDCKYWDLINESFYKFTVNDDYAVRFGMGAIKGVGSGAVATIVEQERR
jgi:hypothetical protein